MHFATFVFFASTFASSLAVPPPQTTSTATVSAVFAKTSDVVSHLTALTSVAAQISTNTTISSSSSAEINLAIQNVNLIVRRLVPATVHSQRDLIGGLLGGLLGGSGGSTQCGIQDILRGDTSLLSGILEGSPFGDLLCGSNGGGILGGLLGGGDLLGGLLDGSLLNGLLGGGLGGLLGGGGDGSDGGDGGLLDLGDLLGGLLGGGGGGLLDPITGLLGGSSALGSACGIPTVSLLVNTLQGLVADLNELLPLGPQCTPCAGGSEFDALFSGLIRDNAAALAPVPLRSH